MVTINEQPNNPNSRIISKAIGYSTWGYENLIHKHYVTWCEEMALRFFHSDRDLIQNEMLFNYYRRQWHILVEKLMLKDYGIYLDKNLPDSKEMLYKILCEYADELLKHYPASLVGPSKKQLKPKYQFNYN